VYIGIVCLHGCDQPLAGASIILHDRMLQYQLYRDNYSRLYQLVHSHVSNLSSARGTLALRMMFLVSAHSTASRASQWASWHMAAYVYIAGAHPQSKG
jgi:hypothetical protein